MTLNRKKVVAVVDDDPGMRRSLVNLLSAFGYAAYAFDSAEAFLRTVATSKADCLVIDVQLRDLSGIELGRQLSDMGFRCPIVFMSAVDDDVIRNQAMQLGCVAYLRKPFTSERLIEAIVSATG